MGDRDGGRGGWGGERKTVSTDGKNRRAECQGTRVPTHVRVCVFGQDKLEGMARPRPGC